MRYVSNECTIPQHTGADLAKSYTYRANSVFDPDLTATGHQPYGRDLLSTIYLRYKVLSAKCTAVFYPQGTSLGDMGTGAITLSTESTGATNATLSLEQPETTWKYFSRADHGPVKVVKYFNSSRFFGRKRNHDLTADIGNTPDEAAFFHISTTNVNNLDVQEAVRCHVTITYKVLYTEPIALGQS